MYGIVSPKGINGLVLADIHHVQPGPAKSLYPALDTSGFYASDSPFKQLHVSEDASLAPPDEIIYR